MHTRQAAKEMAQLVKDARKTAGLTQAKLAKRLGYSSAQFISNWERGKAMPPIDTLPKLAKITGSPLEPYKDVLRNDLERILRHITKH